MHWGKVYFLYIFLPFLHTHVNARVNTGKLSFVNKTQDIFVVLHAQNTTQRQQDALNGSWGVFQAQS